MLPHRLFCMQLIFQIDRLVSATRQPLGVKPPLGSPNGMAPQEAQSWAELQLRIDPGRQHLLLQAPIAAVISDKEGKCLCGRIIVSGHNIEREDHLGLCADVCKTVLRGRKYPCFVLCHQSSCAGSTAFAAAVLSAPPHSSFRPTAIVSFVLPAVRQRRQHQIFHAFSSRSAP